MPAARTATCPNCSSPVSGESKFCPECGAAVSGVSAALGTAIGGMTPTQPSGMDAGWDPIIARLRRVTLGEFDIGHELGRGGMAAVFLAHDMALNRKVAIKVMSPGLLTGTGMIDRFRQEAVTIANLQHANIVTVHAVRQLEDLHFFVMQFIDGQSLDGVLRDETALPLDLVRPIVYQVGSALAYAHRRGVIHRDIKPGNILLSGDGDALVTDFGIAKVADGPHQTVTGMVIGTPSYMSPEQCHASDLTGKSDQYSLGIVAYQMLTGRVPFAGSAYAIMTGHTLGEVPSLREAVPGLPESVEAAIMRMLAKKPEDRFPTLAEALQAMEARPVAEDSQAREALVRLAAVEERRAALGDVLRTPVSPVPRAGNPAPVAQPVTPAAPVTPPPAPLVASAPPVPASLTAVLGGSPAPAVTPQIEATALVPPPAPAAAPPTATPPAATPPAPAPPRGPAPKGRLIAGGGVVLVALVGGWMMTRGGTAPAVPSPTPPVPPAGEAVAQPVAPAPTPTASTDTRDTVPAPVAEPATPPTSTTVARLRFTPPSETSLKLTQILRLRAVLADASSGRTVTGPIRYATSDRRIARVDAAGVVRPVAAGRVTVTIDAGEAGKTSVDLTVLPNAPENTTVAKVDSTPVPVPGPKRGTQTTPIPVPVPDPQRVTPGPTVFSISQGQLASEAKSVVQSFAQAIGSRDLGLVRAMLPSISAQYQNDLKELFEASKSVRVSVNDVRPRSGEYDGTAGSRTSVVATVTIRVVPERGTAPPPQNDTWPVVLLREANGWRIVQVSPAP